MLGDERRVDARDQVFELRKMSFIERIG